MTEKFPPPEIQRAAGQVRAWLDAQDAAKASPVPRRDLQTVFAERLNRCRQFDQSQNAGLERPAREIKNDAELAALF